MSEEHPLPRHGVSLAARIAWAFAAAVVVMSAVAAAGASLRAPAWAVFASVALAGLAVGWWLLGGVVRPATRTLRALRDGVRAFRDRDFSLHLTTRRSGRLGELGELVALYNAIGDVLRDERAALLQRELLFRGVLETAPTALVLANERQRVVFANRAAGELFAAEGGLEGQHFGAILADCPPAMRDALGSAPDSLFSVGGEAEEETYHLSRRSVELNGQRHTLYALRRLTQELRRQEVEVWKRAIRTMSHELNNSLAPIASLARSGRLVLEQEPAERERLATVLEVIAERAAHLRGFLEGYARFARLPKPERREVVWGEFLAELGEVVPFVLAGEPPARPGRFDPAQLQQALINLLKNARESGSPPEEVALAVEPTGEGGVRVKVLDRGSGMSDEVLRSALLPFYSSKQSGSGLGLPLCREILEAHGGHLRIERREGGGTAVVCWIPP